MTAPILIAAVALVWGAAGFALGYRIAQRRATYALVFGPPRPAPMPLGNTVHPRRTEDHGRSWQRPQWAPAPPDTTDSTR